MIVFFAAIALSVAALTSHAFAAGLSDCTDIQTKYGKISGKMNAKTNVCVYKGIPYAAPPVGELRFAPPAPAKPWAETLKATKYGKECLQYGMALTPPKNPSGAEDCLFLNIWQPASSASGKKAVMFFIHGGGFVLGSGSQEFYEGSNLASKGDVIVVTINYRLNIFGFLTHPGVKDADGRFGNYGLLDQIAALKWVNENIGDFGGDAKNITIFGESAGGMSVGALLVSPLAKGLFQKAAIHSGPALLLTKTAASEQNASINAAAQLGCPDITNAASCLRAIDAKKIITTIKPFSPLMSNSEITMGFPMNPIADGYVLPEIPYKMYAKGAADKGVKLLIGSNKDEATLFTAKEEVTTKEQLGTTLKADADKVRATFGVDIYSPELISYYPVSDYPTPKAAYNELVGDVAFLCPSRILANFFVDGQPDTYVYYFQRPLATTGFLKDFGAFHGAELAFVFGNFVFFGMDTSSPENSALADKMIEIWSTFAKTGTPGASGLPAWPKYNKTTQPYMILDAGKFTVAENTKLEQCAFLSKKMAETYGK